MERIDGSCQTKSPERKDFQTQVYLQEQSEPIPTQTESLAKCDFQVQTNIHQDSESIPPLVPAPTIKQEIRMPNIPSSVAQTPAKKRKLSSVSRSSAAPTKRASINESIPTGSGDQLNNENVVVEQGVADSEPQYLSATQSIPNGSRDRLNSEQVEVEDSILNSEVYKIYCREKDPEEAIKKIKELKNCILFERVAEPFPAEEDFKRACETTLDRLWKFEPHLNDSKFDKIKKFINGDICLFDIKAKNDEFTMSNIFMNCLTWINMLQPYGYEFFFIANFEMGPRKSKWYRAESTIKCQGLTLAQLNVLGITNSTISKLHAGHADHSTRKEWFDFANDVINYNKNHLVDHEGPKSYTSTYGKGMLYVKFGNGSNNC